MEFDWRFFLAALGLAMLLESLPYFLFAERMPSLLRVMAAKSPGSLRVMALLVILIGVGLIYLARSYGVDDPLQP
jgi:uncharacterized protein